LSSKQENSIKLAGEINSNFSKENQESEAPKEFTHKLSMDPDFLVSFRPHIIPVESQNYSERNSKDENKKPNNGRKK